MKRNETSNFWFKYQKKQDELAERSLLPERAYASLKTEHKTINIIEVKKTEKGRVWTF